MLSFLFRGIHSRNWFKHRIDSQINFIWSTIPYIFKQINTPMLEEFLPLIFNLRIVFYSFVRFSLNVTLWSTKGGRNTPQLLEIYGSLE